MVQNFCISLPVVLTVFRTLPSCLPSFLPSLSFFSLGNVLFKNCPVIKDKESLWKHSRLKKTKWTSPGGQCWFSTVWASQVAQRVKHLPAMQETGFNLWVGKIPWRRAWQPTPVFLPGESHGQRSLCGYSPWGHKESDKTENTHIHKYCYNSCYGSLLINQLQGRLIWPFSDKVEFSLPPEGGGVF